MKTKIVEAFGSVTMPESCEEKIRTMAVRKRPVSSVVRRTATAAASFAMALVLLLAISPEARAAVSNLVTRYVFPDSGITLYEEIDELGEVNRVVVVKTETPAFAELRDGRLFFTADGQNLDITDEISPENPYFYTFVDDYGMTHHMAVGYSDTLDNFGIYEFMREEEEGQQPWEGWSNGWGRNFLNPETQQRYPWVDIVWEELNVPWPKPGE